MPGRCRLLPGWRHRRASVPLVTMSWGSDLLVDAESSGQMRRMTEFTLGNTDVLIGDCQAVNDKAIEFGFPGRAGCDLPLGRGPGEVLPR